MSELLNGFNNGRDTTDGIGGQNPIDQLANGVNTGDRQLTIPDVSNRYQLTDIKLADWEIVAIGDTKTNKVICHFITENGFDEAVEIAKRITKFLNGC